MGFEGLRGLPLDEDFETGQAEEVDDSGRIEIPTFFKWNTKLAG